MKKLMTWAVIVTAIVMISALTANAATSDWPQFKGDMANSGTVSHSIGAAPTTSWTLEVDSGTWIAGCVLDQNDNIIFLGLDGWLYSVDPNGAVNWTVEGVGFGNWGGCAYSDTMDVVYVTNYGDGDTPYPAEMEAYDASTGTKKWTVDIPNNNATDVIPSIGPDGTIYFAAGSPYGVYAVTDNGASYSMKWTAPFQWVSGYASGSIPIYNDGVDTFVSFTAADSGTSDPNLVCLKDTGDHGSIAWSALTGLTWGQGTVDSNGNYYLATAADYVPIVPSTFFKYDTNGNCLWSKRYTDQDDDIGNTCVSGTQCLSADETTLYVGGYRSKVYSVKTSNGDLNWSYRCDNGTSESEIVANMIVLNDGTLYAVSMSAFYRLQDFGTEVAEVFKVPMPSTTTSTPCVKDDGTLYILPQASTLYAFEPEGANVEILPTSLPDAKASTPYSTFVTAIGGKRAYTWGYTGTLPTELSLDAATGEISGTVTIVADMDKTFNFTVQVTDSTPITPTTDSVALSIYVGYPQIPFANAGLSLAAPGEAYSGTMVPDTSENGTPPFTWSYTGTLPSGMTFVGGTFSGTPDPDTWGDYTVQVSAVSSDYYQAKRSVTISVLDPSLWQMFQNNKRHIGTAATIGPSSFEVKWSTNMNLGNGAPSVEGDAVYHNRGWGNNVFKLDANDGSTLWVSADSNMGHNRNTPCIGTGTHSDRVYPHYGACVMAVDKSDGSTIWRATSGDIPTPPPIWDNQGLPVYSNGRFFTVNWGSWVSVVTDNGNDFTVDYQAQFFEVLRGPVSIFDTVEWGEVMVFGSRNAGGGFSAVTVPDGTQLWNITCGVHIDNAATVSSTNVCFFGGREGDFPVAIALDGYTGDLKWKTQIGTTNGHARRGAGALSFDQQTIYYNWMGDPGQPGGMLVALNTADGTVKWSYPTGLTGGSDGINNSSVIVDKAAQVYAQGYGVIYCLKDDGSSASVVWTTACSEEEGRKPSSFSIGGDGTLYFAAQIDGQDAVWAIKEQGPVKPVITDMERSSMSITFTSVEGAPYKIESSQDPYDYTDEENMTWVEEETIAGAADQTTWTDASPPTAASSEKYYRVWAISESAAFSDVKADDTVGLKVVAMANARNMVSSPFEPYPDVDHPSRIIVSEDFEDNTDGRFENLNCDLDFNLTQEMIMDITLNAWFYAWDRIYQAVPAWDPPPPYDLTGATIVYDEKWVFDTEGGARDFTNQILIFRMYSGYYDDGSMTWSLTGYEDWSYAPETADNGVWNTHTRVQGTGAISDYGGGVYDPSSIYYWRWYGTDWDWDNNDDEIHLRDFKALAPVFMGESTLDKIVGNQLTGHPVSQWASDQVSAWDADAQTYVLAWLRAGQGWRAWDSMDDPPTFGLDADKGYWFTINNTPTNVTFFGRVAKANRTIPMKANRNMAGTCFPVSCALTSSNLVGSGFTGHPVSQWASDKLEFWNAAGQTYVGVWYRAGGGWRAWDDMNNPPAFPYDAIDPGEGWWTTVNNTPFTWTYKVPPRPVED